MTKDDLAAIRARVEAATKGPWKLGDPDHPDLYTYDWPENGEGVIASGDYGAFYGNLADGEFCAHARTDVPKLLAIAEAAMALPDSRIRDECQYCGSDNGHASDCPWLALEKAVAL